MQTVLAKRTGQIHVHSWQKITRSADSIQQRNCSWLSRPVEENCSTDILESSRSNEFSYSTRKRYYINRHHALRIYTRKNKSAPKQQIWSTMYSNRELHQCQTKSYMCCNTCTPIKDLHILCSMLKCWAAQDWGWNDYRRTFEYMFRHMGDRHMARGIQMVYVVTTWHQEMLFKHLQQLPNNSLLISSK